MPDNKGDFTPNADPMPLEEPNNEGPQGMGPDLNMDGPMPEPEMGNDGENDEANSEIDDIFSQLDTEKQAAVIKYAKSMVNGNEPAGIQDEEEGMVTEITNNILDDKKEKPEDREDEKIRNKKVTNANPFVTKSFK
jgi:hypothetical protein